MKRNLLKNFKGFTMTIADKIKAASQKVNAQAGVAPMAAPEVTTVSSQSLKTNAKSGTEATLASN